MSIDVERRRKVEIVLVRSYVQVNVKIRVYSEDSGSGKDEKGLEREEIGLGRVSRVTNTFRGEIFGSVFDDNLVCGARCARDAVTVAEGRIRREAYIALDSTSSPSPFVSLAKKKSAVESTLLRFVAHLLDCVHQPRE
ncbi:uncharacterized protein LOC143188400 [Calliopsis andreniformis]|uniref:uncharacterized protein LOC143188400 n=1 Tax=Calliopsis andreniformis TaxID=337506 RepID=UPI003FCD3ABF